MIPTARTSLATLFAPPTHRVRAWIATLAMAVVVSWCSPGAVAQCQPDWLPSLGFDMQGSTGTTEVRAQVVLPNGDVIVGGQFTMAGGVLVNNIARFDGSGWHALGSGIQGGSVEALALLAGGDVVAAGEFTTAGGLPVTNVARWNGASWSGMGTGNPGPIVTSLAVLANGDVVAGWRHPTIVFGAGNGGTSRWSSLTDSWSPMGTATGQVLSLAVLANGDPVRGTKSEPAGGAAVQRWNGSSWVSIGSFQGSVCVPAVHALLVLPSGTLVAGGFCPYSTTTLLSSIVQWDGTSWTSVLSLGTCGNSVRALAALPNGTYAAAGGNYCSMSTGFSGTGRSLAVRQDGSIFVGGDSFPALAGQTHVGIARWGCPTGHAQSVAVGAGCYLRFQSFYEQFTYTSPFDLSQSTLRMVPTGTGYTVQWSAGAPSFHQPTTPDLGLGDDSVSAPQQLGFTLAYPGGTTNQILVGSNGYVYLQPSTDSQPFYYGWGTSFFTGVPRHAALWTDLWPGSGFGSGTIHFEVVGQVAYATWLNVRHYLSSGSSYTFQIAVFANGDVEYRYQWGSNSGSGEFSGWSPGGGIPDPGSRNLSTTLPFTTTNSFSLPLVQAATSRPVLGTNWNLETRQIPAAGVGGIEILGLSNPNIPDLGFLGMPECGIYSSLDSVNLFLGSGSTHAWSLPIPNLSGLIGLHIHATTVVWEVPASNPAGMISANGLDGTLGVL